MIFGRPVNLWLGLATAIQGAVAVTAVALGADAAIVATISGAWGAVFGAIILVVAGQPPTLTSGDTYQLATPGREPNIQRTVPPIGVRPPEAATRAEDAQTAPADAQPVPGDAP